MTITPLYAAILAVWFFVLSLRVVLCRVGPRGPSLGDGGNPMILRRIRAQANFSEYVPLVLLLIGFVEYNAYPTWWVHILGALLLSGRLLHGYALSFTSESVFGRSAGIVLTFLSLLAAAGTCFHLGLMQSG